MSVERWLGGLSPSTAKTAKSNFNRFLAWIKANDGKFSSMSPDDLVLYQKQSIGDARYEILDLLQTYIQTREGTYQYKRSQMTAVHSFFQHNRVDLPRDINYKIRNTKEGVNGSLSPDEIRKVILSANKTYSTIFLCMFQAGLGEEEFIYWNLHGLAKLQEDLESDAQIISINLPGRKSNRNIKPYFSLLGGDGLKFLREYMATRPTLLTKKHKTRAKESKKTSAETAIFIDQYGYPVSKLAIYLNWSAHTKKAGVNKGKGYTGKNLHEIRDTFRTLFEKSPAEKSVGEFLMGHVIDPLGYNKAHQDQSWVMKEYRKALPFLNILSSERPYGLISEGLLEEQQAKIDAQQKQILELNEKVEMFTITPEVERMIRELAERFKKEKG
jgi:integrase